MEAAPSNAYTSGRTEAPNMSRMTSPQNLPKAEPMRIHGTNKPDGTAMPYVMQAMKNVNTK